MRGSGGGGDLVFEHNSRTVFHISFSLPRTWRPFVALSLLLPTSIAAPPSQPQHCLFRITRHQQPKHWAYVSALFYENQSISIAFVDSRLVNMNPYLPAADAGATPNGATFIAMPSYPLEVNFCTGLLCFYTHSFIYRASPTRCRRPSAFMFATTLSCLSTPLCTGSI